MEIWTPQQNIYACARLNISGHFFSYTFQSDQSLPRALPFILCEAWGVWSLQFLYNSTIRLDKRLGGNMYPRCSCGNTQHQTRKLECVSKKMAYITVMVWKWNIFFYYKSNLVCTWAFRCWEKKKKRGMSTFVAWQITCSPTLIFQGILLSSGNWLLLN